MMHPHTCDVQRISRFPHVFILILYFQHTASRLIYLCFPGVQCRFCVRIAKESLLHHPARIHAAISPGCLDIAMEKAYFFLECSLSCRRCNVKKILIGILVVLFLFSSFGFTSAGPVLRDDAPAPAPAADAGSITIGQKLNGKSGFNGVLESVSFDPGSSLEAVLTVTNSSRFTVNLVLPPFIYHGAEENGDYAVVQRRAAVNGWSTEAHVENAERLMPSETREITVVFDGIDTERFEAMHIDAIHSLLITLNAEEVDSGKTVGSVVAKANLSTPNRMTAYVPEGTQILDNKNLKILILDHSEDYSFLRLYLQKKDTGSFTNVSLDPVIGGYTDYINDKVSLEKGTAALYDLDISPILSRHNISAFSEIDLYLTFEYASKIDRAICTKIQVPGEAETVMDFDPEVGPIIFQDEYCILRYIGIDHDALGRDAILIDFENITQTYIKTLDLTVIPGYKLMELDGKEYPIAVYPTYCWPYTHGYMLIWPEGAPEGTLASASSAMVWLRITRIHSGHLDPVKSTGHLTFDLK